MKGHLQIYHAFIKDPNSPDDDEDEESTNSLAPPAFNSESNGIAYSDMP